MLTTMTPEGACWYTPFLSLFPHFSFCSGQNIIFRVFLESTFSFHTTTFLFVPKVIFPKTRSRVIKEWFLQQSRPSSYPENITWPSSFLPSFPADWINNQKLDAFLKPDVSLYMVSTLWQSAHSLFSPCDPSKVTLRGQRAMDVTVSWARSSLALYRQFRLLLPSVETCVALWFFYQAIRTLGLCRLFPPYSQHTDTHTHAHIYGAFYLHHPHKL